MDGSGLARRGSLDAAALGGLAAVLLAFLLGLFVVHELRFPVGPDAPVYLWWTRLAAHDGLSAVARPGVPALVLVLAGTLHLSPVAVTAALEVGLGIGLGLASAALLRAADAGRATWLLAGLLSGTFTVHLAAGYLANLAFAVVFVAGAVTLSNDGRRSAVAAALLFGAGGLAHPLFLAPGALILGTSAALAFRTDRRETARVGGALVGGALLTGVGMLALLAGPAPLAVDTSRDAFLRRAGLHDILRSAYLDRFVHRWTRYVQWASLPLAAYGLRDADGFVGRFLRAWGLVLVAGVAFGLTTGLFPADRFVTFGFVVPILAAYGLVRLWRALVSRPSLVPGRALAVLATGALLIAMVAGSWIAWVRQEPFMSPLEVERVADANPYAAAFPAGTPLVFVVNGDDGPLTFLSTRAANVIRSGMPPDRIRDVYVVAPPPSADAASDPERAALTGITERDVREAGGSPVTFLLAPFDRIDLPALQRIDSRVSTGVFVRPAPAAPAREPVDPLEPSSPAGIALATFATLALLWVAGYGWARLALPETLAAIALAPAFGVAALLLTSIALERLGVPLAGSAGPTAVSAIAGAGGYLVRLVFERRAGAHASHEVDPEPDK